jgi:hypothetical protein
MNTSAYSKKKSPVNKKNILHRFLRNTGIVLILTAILIFVITCACYAFQVKLLDFNIEGIKDTLGLIVMRWLPRAAVLFLIVGVWLTGKYTLRN